MRTTFFHTIALLAAICSGISVKAQTVSEKNFPFAVQFSPLPSGKGWHGEKVPLSDELMKESVQNLIEHGVTHLATGSFSGKSALLDYAQDQGMMIDCMSGGLELFHRENPPANSVFTKEYYEAMKARVEPVFGGVRNIRKPFSVFPFMDEPFHADTTSFDYSPATAQAFAEKYGYAMPATFAEARKDPLVYVDFINFQSLTFSHAWKLIYDEVKKLDSRPLVTITHDSHNSLGGGAKSNSAWAVDDVFYWGADFADLFIYDIYPYTAEDYRVGESGLVYKPRMSQFHWTLAQMRNLTETYGKKMGFWVGTYNPAWFKNYIDETRRSQYWMERETAYTAIAGGADFLMTGYNIPIDGRHWDDWGESMCVIQKEGGALVDAKRPKAKACFLFPRTQHVLLNKEYFNVALTYELCLRAFGEMDVIHEEQITDDKLLGYDILVLADVELLPEKVASHISNYVRNGGIVIADCVPQTNEKLQPMDCLKDVFGVSYAETYRVNQVGQWYPFVNDDPFWLFVKDWKAPAKTIAVNDGFDVVSPRHCVSDKAKVKGRMMTGDPLLLENKFGKGKTVLFGFCLEDTYLEAFKNDDAAAVTAIEDLTRKVFAKTGVVPSTYSSNPEVEVALRIGSDEAFALVINHEAKDPTAEVVLGDLGFKVAKIVDVQTGAPVAFKNSGKGVKFTVCPSLDSEGGVTRLLKITR